MEQMISINTKTKISKLIKAHPDALETIIELSPDFKKLRNPLLRRLMAGRTSISMAAKMGGCTPEDFFTALEPLGFEIDRAEDTEEDIPESEPMPEYLKNLPKDKIVEFDVRKILEEGKDPLREITQKVKALEPGQCLEIITDFEPVPLMKLLEKQGFDSHVNFVDKDRIETYFFKPDQQEGEKNEFKVEEDASTSGDWDEVLAHFKDNLVEIDVRHLEMPMPMMTILEELETLPDDKALYVNHKKVPIFLLSELKDREFEYRIKDVQEGEVYLIIYKKR